MKNKSLGLFLIAVLTGARGLQAQMVDSYNTFKTAYFHQTGTAAPTAVDAPNAYAFGANLIPIDVWNATVTPPVGDPIGLSYSPPTGMFRYQSGYFGSKLDLDSTFPGGGYDFAIDNGDGPASANLTIPSTELYPSVIPALTPATWPALQEYNPEGALTLHWNNFTANPLATSSYVFVRILDQEYNTTPFSASFLAAGTTSCTIPANTLRYHAFFRLELIFSNRADATNGGFSTALATVGFDHLTHVEFLTTPPNLRVTRNATNAVVDWPEAAGDFAVEYNDNLNSTNWAALNGFPDNANGRLIQTLPMTNSARFFRLKQQVFVGN